MGCRYASTLTNSADSCDRPDRLLICKKELHGLLKEERLQGASLLVFANKQDLPNAMSSEDLCAFLQLDEIKSHHWAIHPCSARTGKNLLEGTYFISAPRLILTPLGIEWIVSDVGSRLYNVD